MRNAKRSLIQPTSSRTYGWEGHSLFPLLQDHQGSLTSFLPSNPLVSVGYSFTSMVTPSALSQFSHLGSIWHPIHCSMPSWSWLRILNSSLALLWMGYAPHVGIFYDLRTFKKFHVCQALNRLHPNPVRGLPVVANGQSPPSFSAGRCYLCISFGKGILRF